MRLAFVFTNFRQGCGVSDYTRLLAEECSRRGHECLRMSLKRRFDPTEVYSLPIRDRAGIRYHFPEPLNPIDRASEARLMLEGFRPDWVSLQFVSYAYHPKGLVLGKIPSLAFILRGFRLQIFFHELWLGAELGAGLKNRFLGLIQKNAILLLLRVLRPAMIQTHAGAYAGLLRKNGFKVEQLPMWGTIPPVAEGGEPRFFELLSKAGLSISPESRKGYWLFGMFGNLHSHWPSEPLFRLIAEAGRRHGRIPVILLGGRVPPPGEAYWKRLASQYEQTLVLRRVGELPPTDASVFLRNLDFGISSTPREIIEKSSATIGMLEHGIPVIVNWGVCVRSLPQVEHASEPLFHFLEEEGLEGIDRWPRGKCYSRLGALTDAFLQGLER